MPAFKVLREEYAENKMPALCMSCGKPAESTREKVFNYTPDWIIIFLLLGILPFLILYFLLIKRRMVAVPLCRRHKNQWLRRYSFIWGSLIVLIGLYVGSAFGGQVNVLLASIFGLVLWLFVALVLHGNTLRIIQLGNESTTFAAVSSKWIEAMKKQRAARMS